MDNSTSLPPPVRSPQNKETKAEWDEERWKRENRFLVHELCIINLAGPGSHKVNLNMISQVRNLNSCSICRLWNISSLNVNTALGFLPRLKVWGTMTLLCIRRSMGLILFHPLGRSKGRVHRPLTSWKLSLSLSHYFFLYIYYF